MHTAASRRTRHGIEVAARRRRESPSAQAHPQTSFSQCLTAVLSACLPRVLTRVPPLPEVASPEGVKSPVVAIEFTMTTDNCPVTDDGPSGTKGDDRDECRNRLRSRTCGQTMRSELPASRTISSCLEEELMPEMAMLGAAGPTRSCTDICRKRSRPAGSRQAV
jgi:hypothetical protein